MGSAVRLRRHVIDHHMDLLALPLQRVDRSAQSSGTITWGIVSIFAVVYPQHPGHCRRRGDVLSTVVPSDYRGDWTNPSCVDFPFRERFYVYFPASLLSCPLPLRQSQRCS